jgi:pimeloyl-ACP methyl ester carboxylesterase
MTSAPDGDGYVTVALPGTLCAPQIFDKLRTELGTTYELHALSWMTDAARWSIPELAKWVADYIDTKVGSPVLVAGHSTGGTIALQLALTAPELVQGLVLINSGPNMQGHGDVESLIATLESSNASDVIATITDRSFHYQPTSNEREQLLDYARGIPARVVLEVLRSQHALDFGPSLGRIRRPVSIVHGDYDGVRTVEQAKAMTHAFADAELHVVDAGHSPMYEAPVAVAAIVRELARRATSAGHNRVRSNLAP